MNHNKLRGLMAERNVSQKQLATIIGINESTLNAKLSGKKQFRADEITAIAEQFDIFGSIEEYFFCTKTCEKRNNMIATQKGEGGCI